MKKVLFICIGNCCRSPMAEGFANYYGKGLLVASSAGVHPAGYISREAVQVMAEKGIDISGYRSQGLSSFSLDRMNWIVTMDATIVHAIRSPSRRTQTQHWPLQDPIGKSPDFFRSVRDQIELKVLDLIELIQKEG